MAAVAAIDMTTAAPVRGAVLESGTEPIEFRETVNRLCDVNGLRVLIEGTLTYRVDARGSEGYLFFAHHVVLDVRFTIVRTGAYVTSHENSMFRDVTVKDSGNGTHMTTWFRTGNAYVIDPSGSVIGRDPGQIRFEVVIDLNSTPQDITGRSDDLCSVVVPELT